MSMKPLRLKVVCDGTDHGTTICDADTGEQISNVVSVSFNLSMYGENARLPTCTIEVANPELEITAIGEKMPVFLQALLDVELDLHVRRLEIQSRYHPCEEYADALQSLRQAAEALKTRRFKDIEDIKNRREEAFTA